MPIQIIFEGNNLVKLCQLLVNDLLSHGVTDTISVDKDVFWHGSIVEVSVALECSLEVVREDGGGDDFLSLHRLRASLGVILAHVGVIGSAEPNSTLFTFVANIDTHKHGLFGDLLAERHSPEIASKLGVHLSDDVQEDSIVVLEDCSVGDELGDNRTVAVDFIFQERIEVLMVGVVRHDHQEEELRVFDGSIGIVDHWQHLFVVVVLDGRGEGIQEELLVNQGLVSNWTDVCILNLNIKTFLLRQVVEFIVDEVGVVHVSL